MTFDLVLPVSLAAFDWSRLWVGGSLTLFIVVCILLVLTILIQKPQGGGLSGAFGAGASGSGQTAFGTKTGDALTWMTIAMFIIYLGAAVGMNYTMRPAGPDTTPPAIGAPPPSPPPPSGTGGGTPTLPESGTTPTATTTTTVKPAETPAPTTPPVDPAAKPADPKPADPAPAPVTPPATTPPATTPR